jgi:hypothetical protein
MIEKISQSTIINHQSGPLSILSFLSHLPACRATAQAGLPSACLRAARTGRHRQA